MAVGVGKSQRANSQRGRLRQPNLDAYYDRQIHSIEPGLFNFRIVLVRPEQDRAERYRTIDRNATELSWEEGDGSLLTGSLNAHRAGAKRIASLPIERGHRIRLLLYWGGRWRRLWDLRVPEVPEVDLATGSLTVVLEDDLSPLHLNEKHWEFKKDKQHPKGWTADQITRAVCKDQHVKPGRMPKGRRQIKKLKLKGSGLEVIRKAWALEKEKTHVRMIIRFRDGVLNCLPFRRPSIVFVIKGIEKAGSSTSAESEDPRPTTQIKAKGRIKQSGKDKKVELIVRSNAALDKFGFLEKEHDYGRVNGRADLREKAKNDLAKSIKVKRTAVLTLPGIPWLEKGSTVKWVTDEPGWSGQVPGTARDRSFGFVTTARHTLLPLSYDSEITITQDDPYFADRKRRDEERRDKKKKERHGRKPKVHA